MKLIIICFAMLALLHVEANKPCEQFKGMFGDFKKTLAIVEKDTESMTRGMSNASNSARGLFKTLDVKFKFDYKPLVKNLEKVSKETTGTVKEFNKGLKKVFAGARASYQKAVKEAEKICRKKKGSTENLIAALDDAQYEIIEQCLNEQARYADVESNVLFAFEDYTSSVAFAKCPENAKTYPKCMTTASEKANVVLKKNLSKLKNDLSKAKITDSGNKVQKAFNAAMAAMKKA